MAPRQAPTEEARQRLKSATAMLADLAYDSPIVDEYRADALAAFDEVEALVLAQRDVVEAAREFLDTMGRGRSRLHSGEIPKGYTADSSDAAIKLFYAVAAVVSGTPTEGEK